MGISPGLGRALGGDEGTFNIDDADMGSAANAKMSVGSLNDVAFNKASLWRNNWTASGNGFGSNPVSQILMQPLVIFVTMMQVVRLLLGI